jgi:hypothetical protein
MPVFNNHPEHKTHSFGEQQLVAAKVFRVKSNAEDPEPPKSLLFMTAKKSHYL